MEEHSFNRLDNVELEQNLASPVDSSLKHDSSHLNLSEYFTESEKDVFLSPSTTNENLKAEAKSENEPVICRIFSETTSNIEKTKKIEDPTKLFFDLIGTKPQPTLILDNQNLIESEENMVSGSSFCWYRNIWLPSEEVKKMIILKVTTNIDNLNEKQYLTMPGVMVNEDMDDLLKIIMSHYLGETEAIERKVLSANDVTQDERGLRELIESGSYRAAINLTSRLLNMYGQGFGRAGYVSKHTPHSLQLWFTRIALLVKIKAFGLAEQEVQPFGQLDKPDIYFEYYPEKYGINYSGSIASFSFRLLLAELPQYCKKPLLALKNLFALLSIVKQILNDLKSNSQISENDKNDALQLWKLRKTRVQHSIINSALIEKDYSLALDVFKILINDVKSLKDISKNQMSLLYSTFGRIYLQLGDIHLSEKYFDLANQLSNKPSIIDVIDKSLISISKNDFNQAIDYLMTALKLDNSNLTIYNNISCCQLYCGNLNDAIKTMEKALEMNPTRGLSDELLINLCTLYELESSQSQVKKLNILKQLARYKVDVFGMDVHHCLKLNV